MEGRMSVPMDHDSEINVAKLRACNKTLPEVGSDHLFVLLVCRIPTFPALRRAQERRVVPGWLLNFKGIERLWLRLSLPSRAESGEADAFILPVTFLRFATLSN
jgi:hypothetical protein